MLSKSFRAAAAAFVLSIAAVAMTTATADAAARPAVGRALQEAIRDAGAGKFDAAKSAVSQAEGISGLTAGDHAAIEQVRQYIAAKSGAVSGKGGLITDYNAGHYGAVIAAGRKGGLDGQSQVLVAQSYYLTHDYPGCTDYIRRTFGNGASDQVLTIQQRCAYESGDKDGQRVALELLVQHTNKPEYWSQLLATAEGTKGLTDHQTLDIYRLKLLTGSLKTADDYMLLAQLALQLGFAAESQSAIQKGIDAKLLSGDRVNRLMGMASGQATANAAGATKMLAKANGDALVKYGEDLWGQGKFPDALKFIQQGIAKGVTDKANAQTRLGQAYLGGGQKDQAVHAFAGADGDPRAKVIGHIWEIYARTH
jgi:hypothetical protein